MAVSVNKEELYMGEYGDVLQLTITGDEAVNLSTAQAVKMFQKSPSNVESEISNILLLVQVYYLIPLYQVNSMSKVCGKYRVMHKCLQLALHPSYINILHQYIFVLKTT